VKHLFADGAYDRLQLMDKAAFLAFTLEIVKRIEAGFKWSAPLRVDRSGFGN
jgi:hypothetical protein